MYPNLKMAIFKRGLRQNHLAREVGIHEVVLSKIIHGFREPSSIQRARLSEYLGADEGWLFEKYMCESVESRTAPPSSQETNRGDS
jgi:transcriptional regulator with XRE-family HTH domain